MPGTLQARTQIIDGFGETFLRVAILAGQRGTFQFCLPGTHTAKQVVTSCSRNSLQRHRPYFGPRTELAVKRNVNHPTRIVAKGFGRDRRGEKTLALEQMKKSCFTPGQETGDKRGLI